MDALISHEEGARAVDDDRVGQLVAFAAAQLAVPEVAEVSVTFVTDQEMAELNERFRGKEGPTDVLPFECDNLDDGFPSDLEVYEAGDIIIAPGVAERQAQELGHSFEEEVDLLLVHGLLHLRGYDHVEDEDAREMQQAQDAILDAWRSSGEGRGL